MTSEGQVIVIYADEEPIPVWVYLWAVVEALPGAVLKVLTPQW